MNKIVVVMASYNGEKYIRQQIDSILNQEGVELRLLVRDDGSTDNTINILEEYQKKQKLEWYTGEHLNVARGFLDLLKKAPEADYYAFCDQDDIWKPKKLFSAIQMIDSINEKRPIMYYSATTLVDSELNFIAEHNIHEKRTDKARFLINDMSGNTIVFNKSLKEMLCKVQDLDITIHDKWTLQLCLATGGRCIGDANSYILYRQHASNTIGMELTLKDKIDKFFRIIKLPHDKHLDLLNEFYYDELIPTYKDLIVDGGKYPLDVKERLKILFDKDINFDNIFFNLAFKIRTLRGIL